MSFRTDYPVRFRLTCTLSREEGRTEEARALVVKLLTRKLGALPEVVLAQIESRSLAELADLGEAVFDLETVTDLTMWASSAAIRILIYIA